MRSIICAEWKRILPCWICILYILMIFVYSVYDNKLEKDRYTYVDTNGNLLDGGVVLKEARQHKDSSEIECILLQGINGSLTKESLDYIKAQNFSYMNYGRQIEELTLDEIHDFCQNRLSHIYQGLEESSTVLYSRQELASLMEEANQVDTIVIGYTEGWSSLIRGMEKFVPLLVLGISIILIPLFGEDAKTNMNEFILATKWGKMPLNLSRIITAYGVGSLLYMCGILGYTFMKFLAFGCEGGNLPIQSDESMFFSIYPLSYMHQFFRNCGVGYLALLVAISFMLLICILVRKMLACSAILCFFWVFLFVGEQMNLYIANHWFFNFMPYRMARFGHYYLENDLYRIAGVSISSMTWTIYVSFVIVLIVTGSMIFFIKIQQKGKPFCNYDRSLFRKRKRR